MRILLLTQWFDPEPAFKGLVFAKALQEAGGHDVEVLTGFPNYPDGKLYPDYRVTWLQRETLNGIPVNRVPLYPSHSSSAVARVLNYASFAISSFAYGAFAAAKADVIYVYHPPVTAALSAALISMVRRVPFVLDINDLWPDSLRASGMLRNKWALALAGKVCMWTYGRASRITVGTPGTRDCLIERGVPPERIEVIYNWCDEQALRLPDVVDGSKFGMEGRFNVVFAGTMGKGQALDAVIRAAKLVQEVDQRVQFVFVGGGIEVNNLKKLAAELHVGNVRFVNRMPPNEVGRVLAAADVLLVHLKNDPLYKITIPSKTQAYMSVGKPILMAVEGDAAQLVASAGAGYSAMPEDEASLADAVVRMARLPAASLAEMGIRGAEFYASNLSLAIGTQRFLDLLHTAAATVVR